VIEGEAEKFGCDGVGFDVIGRGETGDKEGKVGRVVVLHTEVIHHQDKGDWAGGVTEKTGGEGLVKVEALEEGDKTKIGELTCFFEAVHRLLYTEDDVRLSGFVLLCEGMEEKARQNSWGEKVSIYFYVLGGGEGGFKIEVGEVNRPKDSIRRDNGIEQDIDTGEGSDKC
jgi:hypothetical protein